MRFDATRWFGLRTWGTDMTKLILEVESVNAGYGPMSAKRSPAASLSETLLVT